MAKAAVFLIDGFEEIEALTAVDVLRRGQVSVETVSLNPTLEAVGKHSVPVRADRAFEGLEEEGFDILVIPGGTVAYLDHQPFMDLIAARGRSGRKIAAICAAPVVLGRLGLLDGKRAVCYPGCESELKGALIPSDPPAVVTDGPITTSRGPSTALPFALKVLEIVASPEAAKKVAGDMLLS